MNRLRRTTLLLILTGIFILGAAVTAQADAYSILNSFISQLYTPAAPAPAAPAPAAPAPVDPAPVAPAPVVPAPVDPKPFTKGDVFTDSNGIITEFTPTGTVVQTLNTTHPGEGDGMAFDANGNLYATCGFSAVTMVKFDSNGNLVNSNFGGGSVSSGGHFVGHPESVVIDNTHGVLYVGQPDSGNPAVIGEFDLNGNFIKNYSVATEERGSDWVDLQSDLKTIRYTSEGTHILQFNTATNTQLANFNSTAFTGSNAYAHRILSDGGELVADTSQILRLDSSGNVIKTYTIKGTSLLFALNLDPNGTDFWTADYFSHEVYEINIATGAIDEMWNDGGSGVLGGLAVFGEITASSPPATPVPPTVLLFGSGLLGLAAFGRRKYCKRN